MRIDTSIRANEGLVDEQIRRFAPSVFATTAHASRSNRFAVIPTADVLGGLRREGFVPVFASQSRVRDATRRDFTRHLLRLRPLTGAVARAVGDVNYEISIVNANDGSTVYQMDAGLFRLVCLNGMVVADGNIEGIRIRHTGDVVGNVIDGAYEIVREFDRVSEHVQQFRQIELNPAERQVFGRAALVAKYGEQNAYPITVDQVVEPRRPADVGADLWRTFNVVQENVVRGGLESRSATGRRGRTREVHGISQNVSLNKALWTLAEEFAKLKTAH